MRAIGRVLVVKRAMLQVASALYAFVRAAVYSMREARPASHLEKQSSELWERVEKARAEWHDACDVFEQLDDAALVDYAAYEMKARERRYVYLLQAAKVRQHS